MLEIDILKDSPGNLNLEYSTVLCNIGVEGPKFVVSLIGVSGFLI